MSVRFVIGRAGSGKTTWCIDQIVAACRAQPLGRPIYWLLPRQATFQAERWLTCASGLPAFSRVRIYSFEQLGHDVLASCGGLAIPEISTASRQMILAMLIGRLSDHFQFYKSTANQARLAACLDSTLLEIERSGCTPEDLLRQIDPDAQQPAVDGSTLDPVVVDDNPFSIGADAASLPRKLHDLQLLYEHYTQYLGQERLDPDRRLRQVLGCIEQWPALEQADVYVDGFTELSDHQRQVLVSVARVCQNLHITMLMDPDSPVLGNVHQLPADMDLFHQCQWNYRLLHLAFQRGSIVLDEPIRLRQIHRFASAALAQVEATLFDDESQQQIDPSAIQFIQAPDLSGEVEAAAISIRRLQNQGIRLREIAVLMRDMDRYHDTLQAGFAEHEIRFFADRRRSVAHHPLLQLCRHLLLIARDNWPQESILAVLKSGLAGLTRDEADFLENYAAEHHIHHTAWSDPAPWHLSLQEQEPVQSMDDAQSVTLSEPDLVFDSHEQFSETGEPILPVEDYPAEVDIHSADVPVPISTDIPSPESPTTPPPETDHQRADRLRRHVASALTPFLSAIQGQAQLPLAEIVDHLYRVMQALGVRQSLAGWMAQAEAKGHYQQRDEHVQVWRELVELLTSLRDILGAEPISLHRFIQILEAGLERFDLGLTPPTVDQVLVGQIDRTHTSNVKAVILLGMNEGSFPQPHQEDTIFSDADRRGLRQRNIDIHADTTRRLLDEHLLAYIAFTRPSEKLILVRSTGGDENNEASPSIFWQMLWRRCGSPTPETISHDLLDRGPQYLHTPRQLITGLMRWARRKSEAQRHRQFKRQVQSANPLPADGDAPTRNPPCPDSSTLHQPDARPLPVDPSATTNTDTPEDPAWACLYQWLSQREPRGDAIDTLRYRAWRALNHFNRPKLMASTITQLWRGPLVARARQLESFATCPFQHFVRHVLHLEDSHTSDRLTGLDLSGVYHDALRQLVRLMIQERKDWTTLDPGTARQLAAEGARVAAARIRQKVMFSTARNRQTLKFLQDSLDRFIRQQQTLARRQSAKPSAAGVSFGYRNASLPQLILRTPAGHELHLVGTIDRIDRINLENETGFALIDYHLSASAANLAMVQTGAELQMLAHLLFLDCHGKKIDRTFSAPAAGWNVPMERKIIAKDHPSLVPDPETDQFILAAKPAGWINKRFLMALDLQFSSGTVSDALNVRLTKDGQVYKNCKGVISQEQFANLLAYTGKKLGELTDGILSGSISVTPYRVGNQSPCAQCKLHKVCRFESADPSYRFVNLIDEKQILGDPADSPNPEDDNGQ